MKLIMTLLVRNAAGLLRENLEFHLHQGVDFFIVTDNCSNDGTADIIDDYARRGLARRIWEPQDDYSQARWVTRMARAAAVEHGADWVINGDDDEFWTAGDSTLRAELARVEPGCEALLVERYNHPPLARLGAGNFLAEMTWRETRSTDVFGKPLQPKMCHRAHADVEVAQGNHAVSRAGRPLASRPGDAVAISHFPMRDFASFQRKVVEGGSAYARNRELHPSIGGGWRWLHALWRENGLREWYDDQVLHGEHIQHGLARGTLVRDDSVLRALRARGAL